MALTRPTSAQITTTTVDFTDTIIRINSNETGANTNDIGIIFERGSHTNAAIVWDESDDTFRLISTTETGNNSTANINISSHHNLHIGTLISAGLTYPSSDGTGGQVLSTNGSGTLSFISVTATPGGSDTQIQFNSGGSLAGNANLTFDGTTLTSTGFSGPLTGNADTATKWATARTITLGGDLTGNVSIDGSAGVTLTATVAANSVELGADTTGNYVAAGAVSGNGLSGSASSEGATFTVTSNATNENTANTIVFRDSSGNFSANVITATSTSARYADLAENYLADRLYPIGTVLMVGGDQEVTVAVKDSLPVIGTVSENPGYLMNSELCGNYVTPVAYIGRVPCRVVGDVKRGDRLSPSDIPGVAQATNSVGFGQSIGIALENYNDTIEGLIEILVGR
jgi:hypothetical protein